MRETPEDDLWSVVVLAGSRGDAPLRSLLMHDLFIRARALVWKLALQIRRNLRRATIASIFLDMSKRSISTQKRSAPSGDGTLGYLATYRGVRLQRPVARSRFTTDEITRAINVAIKKNPDAFAKGS